MQRDGGIIYVVGIGPGDHEDMTIRADKCLREVSVIVGYDLYVDLVRDSYPGKEFITTPMRKEKERCVLALERAAGGQSVALVCSGDPQVYGLASLLYELSFEKDKVRVEVIPGITAALGGSAVLGAVVNHDFCVISLSDHLTEASLIEKRLRNASEADMVMVLYNPGSHTRPDALKKACGVLLETTDENRICGVVRNIGRKGQEYELMTLKELEDYGADMYTTVFIGNSRSFAKNGRLITPRGYKL